MNSSGNKMIKVHDEENGERGGYLGEPLISARAEPDEIEEESKLIQDIKD